MDLMSFFTTYFAEPLCNPINGYNIYNTLTYGLLTVFVAFGLYKIVTLLKVKVDKNFFWGAGSLVVLGSLWHVYADAVSYCIPFLQTPFIYLIFAGIGLISFALGLYIEKKTKFPYWKFLLSVSGFAFIVSAYSFYEIVRPFALLEILLLTAGFGVVFYLLSFKWKKFFTPINLCVLTAAMFDAASTVIGMNNYGYAEKHILPTYLINLVGTPWIMIPLKLIVVFFALWLIDLLDEDSQFTNIVKFAILVVTVGPATRNTLRILMGV